MKDTLAAARDWLVDHGYALGWALVCRVPESWARQAFLFGGDLAWRRQGPGVQRLEANLRRVIGPEATGKELRILSRAAMRSYARYWMEVFRLPVISKERIIADTRSNGGEKKALADLAAGRGVVFALPHMGNYEEAGAWIILIAGRGFATVAERLKPESLFQRFVAFRESLGFEVLPASGGNSRFGILAQRLRSGGMVCLVADRDVTGSGIDVEFFGEKARMMGGPAALAVQTGAALIPATLSFDGPYWVADMGPEIPVPAEGSRREKVAAMTQQMARYFEAGIAAHPQDWHMLQRVFVDDLDPVRLAASATRGDGLGASADSEPVSGSDASGGRASNERASGDGASGGRASGEAAGGGGASDRDTRGGTSDGGASNGGAQ
jgi:phosphatidylinositol dimannoside acyltransferase